MAWIGYLVGSVGIMIGVTGFTLFLLSKKEIKSCVKQLKQINTRETNQKVTVSNSSAIYHQLAIEINKALEQKRYSKQEHIRIERELREAIANISHDLRTPLTSIMGYLQLLDKEEYLSEKGKAHLKIVQGRSKNLQGLVESFYELSQIESEQYITDYEEVHIERILCELMANFYQDFVDKKLDLQIHIAENLSSIYGNQKVVERILLNLIQNTLRYAKQKVDISVVEEKHQVVLTMMNEAGNLTEEDVPYLFERFFMVNRVRNGEGTGIGLAVVKKLVTLMEGEVAAKLIEDRLAIIISFKVFNG